jgi:hypothetical protein
MVVLRAARVMAAVVGVGFFVFLFLHDSWRSDNLFLVPDLLLSAVLVCAAVVPMRYARLALMFAFGMGTGVIATSVSSYAVRGELGLASLVGALACAATAALLLVRGVGAGEVSTQQVSGTSR